MRLFEVQFPNRELIEALSGQDVVTLAKSGRITMDCLIRQQGQPGWRLVKSVPQIAVHIKSHAVEIGGAVLAGTPNPAPPPPPPNASTMMPEQAPRGAFARRWVVVASMVFMVLLGGLAVVWISRGGDLATGAPSEDRSVHIGVLAANTAAPPSGAESSTAPPPGERTQAVSTPSAVATPIPNAFLESAQAHGLAAAAFLNYFEAWHGDAANEARIAYAYAAQCAGAAAKDPSTINCGLADQAADEAARSLLVAMSAAHRSAEQDHAMRASEAGLRAGKAWQRTQHLRGR